MIIWLKVSLHIRQSLVGRIQKKVLKVLGLNYLLFLLFTLKTYGGSAMVSLLSIETIGWPLVAVELKDSWERSLPDLYGELRMMLSAFTGTIWVTDFPCFLYLQRLLPPASPLLLQEIFIPLFLAGLFPWWLQFRFFRFIIDDIHTDDPVFVFEKYPTDTMVSLAVGLTSSSENRMDFPSCVTRSMSFVPLVSLCPPKFVLLFEFYRDQSTSSNIFILREFGFLHCSVFRRHGDMGVCPSFWSSALRLWRLEPKWPVLRALRWSDLWLPALDYLLASGMSHTRTTIHCTFIGTKPLCFRRAISADIIMSIESSSLWPGRWRLFLPAPAF